ncbi:MAG: hypothetical protein ACOH2H_13820 [Cypionkella sp.]
MPQRFPPLAPQQPIRNRTMAKALPAPSLRWVDFVIFGVVIVLIRLL